MPIMHKECRIHPGHAHGKLPDSLSTLKNYYEENAQLNNYLIARGKGDRVALAKTDREGVTLHFYCQKNVDSRYGSAEPVAQVVEDAGIDASAKDTDGDAV